VCRWNIGAVVGIKGTFKVVRIMLLCQVLMMPVVAQAGEVYNIRQLSEREMQQMYTSMLRDACRHSAGFWHQSESDPKAGYWGSGVSGEHEGIRTTGNEILACGVVLKYCPDLKADERRELRERAAAALRWVVETHLTGTQKCTDGKQWGNNWQSAMWTANIAFGAWPIWDKIDEDLRKGVEGVITFEADRFLKVQPPIGRWGDTKAEENAWDNLGIAVAANMFPSHPHAADWREKSIEYMMNTLSVPRDLKDSTVVDGKPVSEWVHGANLNPDFTLENHNILHPSYLACSSYMLGEALMMYTYGRNPVPAATTHHLMDTWDMYQTILFAWGQYACPQGMDWDLHGTPVLNLQAFLATYKQDAVAARMEQSNLQCMRAWQQWAKGDMNVPGGKSGFARHSICEEQAAWAYLSHRIFGAATQERPAGAQAAYVRRYSSVDVILHRTKSKLVTFSWKNRIMGVFAPASDAHPNDPYFTVPVNDGLRGTLELDPAGDNSVKLDERTCTKRANGFETTGTLITKGGRLRQTIKVTSIGEKVVVYQDRVIAETDTTVALETGVPVGIENDSINGGKRLLSYEGGSKIIDWQKRQKAVRIPGTWANVDGRLAMVMVSGSGLAYNQASDYNGQAVYADMLCGSYSDKPRSYKAGDEVARRIVVLAVEITPEETAALAKSVRTDGNVLRVALPEGGEAEIPLL
jgi:hypothetical protein